MLSTIFRFFCLFSFGHLLSDFRFPAFDNLVQTFLDLYITYENYLFMNNFLFRMMVEKQNEKLAFYIQKKKKI